MSTTAEEAPSRGRFELDDLDEEALALLDAAEEVELYGGIRAWIPHKNSAHPESIRGLVVGASWREVDNEWRQSPYEPEKKWKLSLLVRTKNDGDWWLGFGFQSALTWPPYDVGMLGLEHFNKVHTVYPVEYPDWLLGSLVIVNYKGTATSKMEGGSDKQLYSVGFFTPSGDPKRPFKPVEKLERGADDVTLKNPPPRWDDPQPIGQAVELVRAIEDAIATEDAQDATVGVTRGSAVREFVDAPVPAPHPADAAPTATQAPPKVTEAGMADRWVLAQTSINELGTEKGKAFEALQAAGVHKNVLATWPALGDFGTEATMLKIEMTLNKVLEEMDAPY